MSGNEERGDQIGLNPRCIDLLNVCNRDHLLRTVTHSCSIQQNPLLTPTEAIAPHPSISSIVHEPNPHQLPYPHTPLFDCPRPTSQPIGWRVLTPASSLTNLGNESRGIDAVFTSDFEGQPSGTAATHTSTLPIELQRQLNQTPACSHLFLLTPFSKVLHVWMSLVSLAVIYNLWLPIALQSFYPVQQKYRIFWLILDTLTDFLYLMDIFVRMGTTYLEFGLPVLSRRKIVTRYMKTTGFRLDLLALLPLDIIQVKVGNQPMLRFPRFIKVHRLIQWSTNMELLCKMPCIWRLLKLLHMIFLGCHWCACLYYDLSAYEGFHSQWGYIPEHGRNTTLLHVYMASLYWATLALTTIGIDEPPTTSLEFIFTCLAYLFGLFVFATVVGQVGSIINSQNAARVAFEEVLDNVKNYMRLHSVRDDLQSRILRWYDYAWHKKSMNGVLDVSSLEMLPEKLKTELVMDVNYETLKKIALFKECRPEFLHDLVLKMKPLLFTPGDYVCRKGEIAREMFIIADGVLEALGANNEVLAMMASGDMFGEIGVLRIEGQNKRTADVRAVGYTELYVLSRDDVMEALEDHPEAEMYMLEAARRRLYGAGGSAKEQQSARVPQPPGPTASVSGATPASEHVKLGFRTSLRQEQIATSISDLIAQVQSTKIQETLQNFAQTWQILLTELVQAYEGELRQLREELNERPS